MTDLERQDHQQLIRLVRVARGLEAEGYFNAAKLLWALVFSGEIRASNSEVLPRAATDLDEEFAAVIEPLKATGEKAEVIATLEAGRQGARENRTIPHSEVPDVHVCRTCGEIIIGAPEERCPVCRAHFLTFRFMVPAYYLDPLSPPQALIALQTGPDRIQSAVAGLDEEQMNRQPAPGEWSARELLWHLLAAQTLFAGRVEKLLTEENPSLAAAATWMDTDQENRSAGDIFERYRESRQRTLERLEALSLDEWWRVGWHDEWAQVTVLDQATYFARHEHSHLAQFDAIRAAIQE